MEGFEGEVFDYAAAVEAVEPLEDKGFPVYRGVMPAWDNTAWRGKRGWIYAGSTPERYGEWLHRVAQEAADRPGHDDQFVFINAWNEWAEGATLEPSQQYGRAYLEATRAALERVQTHSGLSLVERRLTRRLEKLASRLEDLGNRHQSLVNGLESDWAERSQEWSRQLHEVSYRLDDPPGRDLWLSLHCGLAGLLLKLPFWLLSGRLGRDLDLWREARRIRRGGLFNPRAYLEHYPDVGAAGVHPLYHYVRCGAAEGRDPRPDLRDRRPAAAPAVPATSPSPTQAGRWVLNQDQSAKRAGAATALLFVSHDAARGGSQIYLLEILRSFSRFPEVELYLLLRRGGELRAELARLAHVFDLEESGATADSEAALVAAAVRSLGTPPAAVLSTGPGLLVPAAAAIRVFGNRYWVPGAVVVVLDFFLLIALFRHLVTAAGNPGRWAPAAIAAVVALNLLTIGHYEHWYALLGEVPALLLLCLAAGRTSEAGERWPGVAGGGLLLGWAYQVKTLAALTLPVVLVAIVLGAARGGGRGLRRGLRAAAVAAALFCVPTLLFEAFKVADLGWEGYRQMKAAEAQFMVSSRESGVHALLEPGAVEYVRTTGAQNWQVLSKYFRADWAATAFLVALALGLAARHRWLGRDSPLPLVLVASAAVYAAWWLLLSTGGRVRYLLIGLGLWCCAVVFDLFVGKWSMRKLALALAFAAAVLPRADHLGWIAPPRPLFRPSPQTAAMLEAERFLEDHRRGRVIAADWWATGSDMEYLLAGSGNLVFHQALDRLAAPRVLFFENAKWIDLSPGVRDRWQATLARYAATPAFERSHYRIYAAPPLGVEP